MSKQQHTNDLIVPSPSEVSPEIQAELDRLRSENAALLAAAASGKLTLKISVKRAVSLYGLGRFPVTLYGEQWLHLLDFAEEIRGFVTANRAELATKTD